MEITTHISEERVLGSFSRFRMFYTRSVLQAALQSVLSFCHGYKGAVSGGVSMGHMPSQQQIGFALNTSLLGQFLLFWVTVAALQYFL